MEVRKAPLERRRRKGDDLTPLPSHLYARRESDQSRMRVQHWMELADTALQGGAKRQPKKSRD
jgi:hypothetical protein